MKKDQREKIRQKSVKELQVDLQKMQKELVELRFKLVQGQLKNVKSVGKLRDEIAFIKMLLAEKIKGLKVEKNQEK